MKKLIFAFGLVALVAIFQQAFSQDKPQKETPKDVGDRIDRNADRDSNAGKDKSAQEGREAADRAREAPNVDKAIGIEKDYNKGNKPESKPVDRKPH